MEKEEKEGPEIKKDEVGKKKLNIPAYLIALFLILGITGGIALKLVLFPEGPDGGNGNGGYVNKVVDIILLYSDSCEFCLQSNSILDSFSVNEVQYAVRKVEASSEEGGGLLEIYGVNSVPTALVEYEKLALYYSSVKNAMDAAFLKVQDRYVVPESQLNVSAFYPVMFLEQPGEGCIDNEGIVDVLIFDDPYSPASLNSKVSLTDVWLDLNQYVNVGFNYTPADISGILPDYNIEDALLTSKFLTCASEQGKYLEMDIFFRGIFCNLTGNNEDELTKGEIAGCGLQSYVSTHQGRPLSQLELDVAANKAGLSTETLAGCYENADEKIQESVLRSVSYNIMRAPTALIDCKYAVSSDFIKDAICTIDSAIGGCS